MGRRFLLEFQVLHLQLIAKCHASHRRRGIAHARRTHHAENSTAAYIWGCPSIFLGLLRKSKTPIQFLVSPKKGNKFPQIRPIANLEASSWTDMRQRQEPSLHAGCVEGLLKCGEARLSSRSKNPCVGSWDRMVSWPRLAGTWCERQNLFILVGHPGHVQTALPTRHGPWEPSQGHVYTGSQASSSLAFPVANRLAFPGLQIPLSTPPPPPRAEWQVELAADLAAAWGCPLPSEDLVLTAKRKREARGGGGVGGGRELGGTVFVLFFLLLLFILLFLFLLFCFFLSFFPTCFHITIIIIIINITCC